MIEKVFAGLVLAACAVMGVRLLLGDARRWRFDAFVRRSWRSARRTVVGPVRWWHYRRVSARAAEDVIRRARNRVDRDGNVYTPKNFGKDKKPH
jgi:DNA primase large subunit